jgi:hypothetical protein
MAVLHLGKGTVRASLSDLGWGQYDLKITTEAGMVLAGRRSLFTLQMEDATVRITCVQGEVSWNSARGKSAELVPAGYSCAFRSGDEAAGRLLPVSNDAKLRVT